MTLLAALTTLAAAAVCLALRLPGQTGWLDEGGGDDDELFRLAEQTLNTTPPLLPVDLDGLALTRAGSHCEIRLNGEPKSGTTWLEQIVFRILIHVCAHNDHCSVKERTNRSMKVETLQSILDFHGNRKKHRIPYSGRSKGIDFTNPPRPTSSHIRRNARQFLHGHRNKKWLAIFRDPRSVTISTCFHLVKDCPDRAAFTLQHIRVLSKWIDLRYRFWRSIEELDAARVKLLYFEDLKEDPRAEVRGIANFFGLAISPEGITRVLNETRIEHMRRDAQIPRGGAKSGKVREGKVCNYKDDLPERAAALATQAMRDELSPELLEKWTC